MKATNSISNYLYKDPKSMSIEEIDKFINSKSLNRNLNSSGVNNLKKKNLNQSINFSFNIDKSHKSNKESLNKKTSDGKLSNSGPKKRNSYSDINLKMSNDYIKILQEKIILLQKENKHLKSNFIKLNEILNSERNSKRNDDTNINLKINKNIYNEEFIQLKQHNEYLIKENNILKTQINEFNNENNKTIEDFTKKINEYQKIINQQKEEIKSLKSDILIFNEKYEKEKEKKKKDKFFKSSFSNYDEENLISKSERNSKRNIIINNKNMNLSFSKSNDLNSSHQKSNSLISNYKTMKNKKKKSKLIPVSNLSILRPKSASQKIIKVNRSLSKGKKEEEKKKIKKEIMETPNKYNCFEFFGNNGRNINNNIENIDIERTPQFKTFREESSKREKNHFHNYNNEELESINNQIPIVESSIEQLKYNYNKLINKLGCCQSCNEINEIRGNLKLISINLEEKTFQLLTLKTQQQKLLKSYLD